jgi:threonine/homoserine/homoserine lactone efflux protein
MNLLSPGPYLFWATVNGPLLRDGLEQSIGHGAAFLIAFYGVFLGMMAVVALIFDRLRRVDERLTRGLLLAAIVVLGGFGIYLIVQGFGQLSAPA